MGDLVPIRPADSPPAEPLWRDVVGDVLRDRRHERGETLGETASRAGVSTQYLSEVERGRKDPSSEVVSAIAGALGLSLRELAFDVARRLPPPTASRRVVATPVPRGTPLACAA